MGAGMAEAAAQGAPEAVVLDIGNVLVEWDPPRFYDREIGPERRRALFAAVDLDGMNAAVDLGAPFAGTVEACARANPEWRREILMWRDRWIEICAPPLPRSVRLLRALRARGVPVLALSNFGAETFALAQRSYPALAEFDRVFISGAFALMKPDPAFYERLEREAGLSPRGILFTDDRPENVDAARARGWRTHLFEGPEGWAGRLVAEGLLSEEEAA
jgi:2-haloacid dehalogenase